MKKILFVDDEKAITECFEILFSDLGYKVFTASEGKEALEVVKKNQDIDMLVTDLNMPNGMGGVELISNLPEDFKNKKILVMSGYVENELLVQGNHKITAFLSKPINTKKILGYL